MGAVAKALLVSGICFISTADLPGLVRAQVSPAASTAAADAAELKGWSGKSGSSGHPSMTADAILASAKAFPACIEKLWPAANARGISRDSFDNAIDGLKPNLQILDYLDSQPEFAVAIWDYLDKFVNPVRLERGREMLARYRSLFDEIEKTFGIDRYIVAAIWGVETNFGTEMGTWPVLETTATLACIGRRQNYFSSQFVATLEILDRGDIKRNRLKGTWSGSFGQTNMMPSSYKNFAVDFDHDGRVDAVDSVGDALASTAVYLRLHGWVPGVPWGEEVALPDRFDYAAIDPAAPVTATESRRLGITNPNGRPLEPFDGSAVFIIPAGAKGPAFLAFKNYEIILRYNPSGAYALTVAHLSDRLRGGEPIHHPWPRNERALSAAERLELQQRLTGRGFDIARDSGGRFGSGTRHAISQYQVSLGMVADGFPTAALLDRLRSP